MKVPFVLQPGGNSKFSHQYLYAFGANTTNGKVKKNNEDKVSIFVMIDKPNHFKGNWPEVHFFGIYDGHGGDECSEFLKQNLHKYIIEDPLIISNTKQAILNGFK